MKYFLYFLGGLVWFFSGLLLVASYPINLAMTYFEYRGQVTEGGIRIWRKFEKKDRFLEWKEIKEIEEKFVTLAPSFFIHLISGEVLNLKFVVNGSEKLREQANIHNINSKFLKRS